MALEPSVLDLPEPCLLKILQCCAADDQRSVCSAARAHSRLHQAAVAALRSITAVVFEQQGVESVLQYLLKHGQHVDSIHLVGDEDWTISLCQLPPNLQLSSLQLRNLRLQLQPGGGFQGVLGAAAGTAALKQLRLRDCRLLDAEPDEGLAAALSQLPAGLEHLSVSRLRLCGEGLSLLVQFPTAVLHRLQQLTYLELALAHLKLHDSEADSSPALQPLQALTRLVDLRVQGVRSARVTASILSGTQHLTRLQVIAPASFEPGALAGKTQLQHLQVEHCGLAGGAAGVAQVLSHLQPLQQLTHLSLSHSLRAVEGGNPPAAAYAALTASSKLQHLDIAGCRLPAGAWQHVFPAGRQLPHLRSLDIHWVRGPTGDYAAAPEFSRVVGCCPSLQSLDLSALQYSAELRLLAPLLGLSGLHTLRLAARQPMAVVAQVLCQLKPLRQLAVDDPLAAQGATPHVTMLPLTQLKQLTMLTVQGRSNKDKVELTCQAPGDEPVWHQLWQVFRDFLGPNGIDLALE